MQPKVFKLLFIAERRKIVEGPNLNVIRLPKTNNNKTRIKPHRTSPSYLARSEFKLNKVQYQNIH